MSNEMSLNDLLDKLYNTQQYYKLREFASEFSESKIFSPLAFKLSSDEFKFNISFSLSSIAIKYDTSVCENCNENMQNITQLLSNFAEYIRNEVRSFKIPNYSGYDLFIQTIINTLNEYVTAQEVFKHVVPMERIDIDFGTIKEVIEEYNTTILNAFNNHELADSVRKKLNKFDPEIKDIINFSANTPDNYQELILYIGIYDYSISDDKSIISCESSHCFVDGSSSNYNFGSINTPKIFKKLMSLIEDKSLNNHMWYIPYSEVIPEYILHDEYLRITNTEEFISLINVHKYSILNNLNEIITTLDLLLDIMYNTYTLNNISNKIKEIE